MEHDWFSRWDAGEDEAAHKEAQLKFETIEATVSFENEEHFKRTANAYLHTLPPQVEECGKIFAALMWGLKHRTGDEDWKRRVKWLAEQVSIRGIEQRSGA